MSGFNKLAGWRVQKSALWWLEPVKVKKNATNVRLTSLHVWFLIHKAYRVKRCWFMWQKTRINVLICRCRWIDHKWQCTQTSITSFDIQGHDRLSIWSWMIPLLVTEHGQTFAFVNLFIFLCMSFARERERHHSFHFQYTRTFRVGDKSSIVKMTGTVFGE